MNAQVPMSKGWQSIGDLAARLVEKETRQRANAPGDDRQQKENDDD